MIPVVSTEQMKAVDGASVEPAEVLIGRAGRAVAAAASAMLGGSYGRRVTVVAGKGNNGADGRAAALILSRRGVRVRVLDAASLGGGERLAPADLIIDAAYGTGFRGVYLAPDPGGVPVLAVDIPSGLAGDTGLAGAADPAGEAGRSLAGDTDRAGDTGSAGAAVRATATVTFQAYKPGLLLGAGPLCCGVVEVADIGLGAQVRERCSTWLVSDVDARTRIPVRGRDAHKWQAAVAVIAGSPGMMGAASMASRAAMRAGAGYVRLGVPGGLLASLPSAEAVGVSLPAADWAGAAVDAARRCRCIVVGPGLGRGRALGVEVRRMLCDCGLPVVVDADALFAVGNSTELQRIVARRSHPTVITPHDGEYTTLFGAAPAPDRLAGVRQAAASTGAIVLLKGATTIVAHPDGRALLSASGSPRLASAGTGDVLSGLIGAFIARGADAFEAAALAAHVHGRAAGIGMAEGLVAGDLPNLVARWLSQARAAGAGTRAGWWVR